jgi:putative addiction module component (TIGR02574 family)
MHEMSSDLTQFDGLSLPQKLQLVEDLWDRIADTPASIPVPDWQKEELDRREVSDLANPVPGIPWEEVQRQIREGNE